MTIPTPPRARLTLKKPSTAQDNSLSISNLKPLIPAKPSTSPTPSKSNALVERSASPTTQTKPGVTPKKTKEKPTPQAEKALKKQENIQLSAEFVARKREQVEALKPIVKAYFAAKPIMSETVEIDGVTCLKPLAVGTGKTVFATLKACPEFVDCTNTTLNQLIIGVLQPHTLRPEYLAGVLAFAHRHTVDGEPTGEVTPKQKANAIERMNPK